MLKHVRDIRLLSIFLVGLEGVSKRYPEMSVHRTQRIGWRDFCHMRPGHEIA